MRFLRFFPFLFILLALGLIGVDQVQGDGQPPTVSLNITWTLNTIDATGDVGQYSSLAINPVTGLPHVSYYDATNYDLRHAYMTNNPINTPCLVIGWKCETWSTPFNDGSFSTIAFRSTGNYGILYENVSQYRLYIRGDQGDGIPASNNSINSVAFASRRSHNLKYDRNGVPHVTFVKHDAGDDTIYHAKYVGSGGICDNSAFDCEVVIGLSQGQLLSTAMDLTYYGSPRVVVGSSYGLDYVVKTNGNPNCGSSTWICFRIENGITVSSVALYEPTCQILCSSPVQIAYYDLSNSQLKLATNVSSGGNCGVADQVGKWQCDIIETIGANENIRVSLYRFNDQPFIAYTDSDDRANTTLKIAYPSPQGNCGPTPNGVGTWQCDTIDTGLRFVGGFPIYHSVGQYPSIKINSAGTIYISYYDSAAGDLLVAEGQFDSPPPPPPTGDYKIFLPVALR